VIDHHSQIVDALKARDPDGIRMAIGIHLARLATDIVEAISEESTATPETTAESSAKVNNQAAE
jgi:DNA-binding GntR family transcriptional regulator